MKKLTFIIMFVISTQINFAQPEFGPPYKMGKKFRQLEKIKLLEVLDLDEETAIRFFTRKNTQIEKQKKVIENHKKKLDKIEDILKNETPNESELLSLITKIEDLELKIHQGKKIFIDSVKDILTTKQIAKLVLFEYKFKKDVRDLLIKGGKNRFLKQRGNRKKFD